MNSAYLLIGGNLGDRIAILTTARNFIESELGNIIKASSIYETAAWGIKEQPDFLNQVLLIKTILSAEELIKHILLVEEKMGRIRTQKNASRVIDIDVLFFNDRVLNTPLLTVPHPQIQYRKFTLIPLAEMAPNFIHPVLKKSIKHLLMDCRDELEVRKVSAA